MGNPEMETTSKYVLIQLEHNRKTVLVVPLAWLMDQEKVEKQLSATSKLLAPVFFFYTDNLSSKPTF